MRQAARLRGPVRGRRQLVGPRFGHGLARAIGEAAPLEGYDGVPLAAVRVAIENVSPEIDGGRFPVWGADGRKIYFVQGGRQRRTRTVPRVSPRPSAFSAGPRRGAPAREIPREGPRSKRALILTAAIEKDMEALVREATVGDRLRFPMHGIVARGTDPKRSRSARSWSIARASVLVKPALRLMEMRMRNAECG